MMPAVNGDLTYKRPPRTSGPRTRKAGLTVVLPLGQKIRRCRFCLRGMQQSPPGETLCDAICRRFAIEELIELSRALRVALPAWVEAEGSLIQ